MNFRPFHEYRQNTYDSPDVYLGKPEKKESRFFNRDMTPNQLNRPYFLTWKTSLYVVSHISLAEYPHELLANDAPCNSRCLSLGGTFGLWKPAYDEANYK